MATPKSIEDLRALDFKRKRRIWKPFMEKYSIDFLVELGVFEGYNFRLMVEHGPDRAVGVDAWLDDGITARNDCGYPQERLNAMHNAVVEEHKDKDGVDIMRMYTRDAAKFFPDDSFDLIYIDADHTEEGCRRDIEDWYPKIRSGGFVTGDDYSRYRAKHTGVVFGVIEAVDKYFAEKGLTVYELPAHGWAVIKP